MRIHCTELLYDIQHEMLYTGMNNWYALWEIWYEKLKENCGIIIFFPRFYLLNLIKLILYNRQKKSSVLFIFLLYIWKSKARIVTGIRKIGKFQNAGGKNKLQLTWNTLSLLSCIYFFKQKLERFISQTIFEYILFKRSKKVCSTLVKIKLK